MKQALHLRLSQQLTLTPQLQQAIRLLQLSSLELQAEVEQILQENPFLDRDDDSVVSHETVDSQGSDTATSESMPESGSGDDNVDTFDYESSFEEGYDHTVYAQSGLDDNDPLVQIADATRDGLQEHLRNQLRQTPLSDEQYQLVALLIESLDEDGCLSTPLGELSALLPLEQSIGEAKLSEALAILQSFDPVGVGARSLSESLCLQLLGEDAVTVLAREVVKRYIDVLARHDFKQLKKLLACSDSLLRQVHERILSLDPRPCSRFMLDTSVYVEPDVLVRKVNGRWVASLNSKVMPKLRVNHIYADILSRNRSHPNLSLQLQEARWLIRNIQQRFETVLNVSQAIVDRQSAFFEQGDIAMLPLVLRDIADELGLHESTVSRVTMSKYLLAPQGVFELKHFFSSHVATGDGGMCSSTSIRVLIRQLIAQENPNKPLSDSVIVQMLGERGIVVARRTVAKYRDILNIPPVGLRKCL